MQYFVWSWKRDEPNPAFSCTLMDTDGRWRTVDCNESHRAACQTVGSANELIWQVSATSVRNSTILISGWGPGGGPGEVEWGLGSGPG